MPSRAFCCVSVAPLRREAKESSEMVSQVLFGERMEILDKHKTWFLVRLEFDSYEGWIDAWHLKKLNDEQQITDVRYSRELYNLALENDYPLILPLGCDLSLFHENKLSVENKAWIYEGVSERNLSADLLPDLVMEFINTPYLWGGRSNFGIDCSGLVQTVYRFFGVNLPRDAYQQAECGVPLDFVTEARVGDLAFFDNEEGRITHVGIMLSPDRIIHSHGKVRIDSLDNNGIYIQELKKYSHQLRFMRRVFD